MGEVSWLTTRQAADLLGVRVETVYAYVSRGLLARHRSGRSSVFARTDVELLAARGHRRTTGRPGTLELVIDTELTLLDPDGHLYYRGHDALELATSARFEEVAALLWNESGPSGGPWRTPARGLAVARRAVRALPGTARLTDRMRVAVASLAATDPAREDRDPAAVTRAARSAIAAAVDTLPLLGPASPEPGESLAKRLWARVCARVPRARELRALEAALILVADHELAASTLAARDAASTWADPYLVLLTGLAVGGGALHGAVSAGTEALLRNPAAVELATAQARAGEPVPGFGHKVYADTDPRAELLLALVFRGLRRASVRRTTENLVQSVRAAGGPGPNVDLALAALVVAFGLEPGSGEAIFLLARMVGVTAHALEEYPHRLRFRPRAVYTGRPPRRGGSRAVDPSG